MRRFLLRLADRYSLKLSEQEIQAILQFARASSEYPGHEERLEKLARQVRSGKYRIDYARVAEGILGDGFELSLVDLAKALKQIPSGPEHWRMFEKASSLLIPAVFGLDLGHFASQYKIGIRSIVDLYAYNQSCRGFWHDMKTCHAISHVIFEVKNKKRLERNDIGQILRYARPFRAVVVLTKEPHPQSIYKEVAGLLRESKMILPISTHDLEKAADLAEQGRLGSESLIPRYQQLVAALP